MPFVTSGFLFLVVIPGATRSFLLTKAVILQRTKSEECVAVPVRSNDRALEDERLQQSWIL